MANARRAEIDVVELNPDLASKPKLVVTLGRGGTGKSTFVRVLAERAQLAGRSVVIADADRTNATLAAFFKDVVRPAYPDEKTVHDWLDALVNEQAESLLTVALDMGGGDQTFKRFALSIELAGLLDSVGIVPVALHFIGPDTDDMAYLRDIEETNAFCPAQTVLVLNEGLIKDARPFDVAFADIRNHDTYRAALKRGAREIVFPRLACMQEINSRRISFSDAQTQLGLTNRQRVSIWRRDVEAALTPIVDWLP
jgi:hypothetical protein